MPKSPLRSPERRNRAAFDGRSSRERGIERGRSAKTVASRRRIAYPVRAMKAKMVILIRYSRRAAPFGFNGSFFYVRYSLRF